MKEIIESNGAQLSTETLSETVSFNSRTFRSALPNERKYLYGKAGWSSLLIIPALLLGYIAVANVEQPMLMPTIWFLSVGGFLLLLAFCLPMLSIKNRDKSKDICRVEAATLEIMPSKGMMGRKYCRLKESKIWFRVPRKIFPQLKQVGEIDGDIEFFLNPPSSKVTGKLVSIQSVSQSYSLSEQLKRRPIKNVMSLYWRGVILFIMGVIFTAILAEGNRDILPQMIKHVINGPMLIEKADDTLAIQRGSLVKFNHLLVQKTQVGNDFIPLKSLKNAQVLELIEQWESFGAELSALVRYASGQPFSIDDSNWNYVKKRSAFDFRRELESTDPDRLMAFLSRRGSLYRPVILNDIVINACVNGKNLELIISSLVLDAHNALISKAKKLFKPIYNLIEINSEYPILSYADLSSIHNFMIPEKSNDNIKKEGRYIRDILVEYSIKNENIMKLNGVYFFNEHNANLYENGQVISTYRFYQYGYFLQLKCLILFSMSITLIGALLMFFARINRVE